MTPRIENEARIDVLETVLDTLRAEAKQLAAESWPMNERMERKTRARQAAMHKAIDAVTELIEASADISRNGVSTRAMSRLGSALRKCGVQP